MPQPRGRDVPHRARRGPAADGGGADRHGRKPASRTRHPGDTRRGVRLPHRVLRLAQNVKNFRGAPPVVTIGTGDSVNIPRTPLVGTVTVTSAAPADHVWYEPATFTATVAASPAAPSAGLCRRWAVPGAGGSLRHAGVPVRVRVVGCPPHAKTVKIVGRYAGNVAHDVVISQYRYNTASWVRLTSNDQDLPPPPAVRRSTSHCSAPLGTGWAPATPSRSSSSTPVRATPSHPESRPGHPGHGTGAHPAPHDGRRHRHGPRPPPGARRRGAHRASWRPGPAPARPVDARRSPGVVAVTVTGAAPSRPLDHQRVVPCRDRHGHRDPLRQRSQTTFGWCPSAPSRSPGSRPSSRGLPPQSRRRHRCDSLGSPRRRIRGPRPGRAGWPVTSPGRHRPGSSPTSGACRWARSPCPGGRRRSRSRSSARTTPVRSRWAPSASRDGPRAAWAVPAGVASFFGYWLAGQAVSPRPTPARSPPAP